MPLGNRPPSRTRAQIAAIVLAAAFGCAPGWAQSTATDPQSSAATTTNPPSTPPATPTSPKSAADERLTEQAQAVIARLFGEKSSETVRRDAALWLLDHGDLDPVFAALERAVAMPLSGQGAGTVLLDMIAQCGEPPSRLINALEARLQSASEEESARIVRAMGYFRSRSAARLLLDLTRGESSEDVAAAAYESLANLTARDDFGSDHEAWETWIRSYEDRNELEWQQMLASNLAEKLARQTRETAAATTRLIETMRRLHLATPADQRPTFLVDLLRDPQPQIRDLGFELVGRELSNNGQIDAMVGIAAIELLASPIAYVRGQAALLVRQIAPAGAADAVATALERETDPQAASDLLLAATRWPTPASVSAVLTWLGREGQARPAAIEACLQIMRSASLRPVDAQKVLAVLRGLGPTQVTPAAAILLVELGDASDQDRLLPLLHCDDLGVRSAVADALLWERVHKEAIIDAASDQPDLVFTAIKAVMVDNPTSQEVIRVMRLKAPTPQEGRQAMAMLAAMTPADQLLPVVQACTDPLLRTVLLNALTAPSRAMSEHSTPAAMEAIVAGVLLLAEEDLSLGNAPAAALLLDASPFMDEEPWATRAAALRVPALLATGKVEEAQKYATGLDPWWRGFELAKGTSRATDVAAAVLARFGERLDEARRDLLLAATAGSDVVGPPEPK
ncbi:MAG: hypothetical protein NTV94_05820 [Planctomycetota bacterium]|nr:hypothetical protein [Planctomycetota bacterium]